MLHFRCQCRAKGSVDSVGEYQRESGALEGGQSRKYRFGRYLKEVVAGAIRIDEIINEKLTQTERAEGQGQNCRLTEGLEENQSG